MKYYFTSLVLTLFFSLLAFFSLVFTLWANPFSAKVVIKSKKKTESITASDQDTVQNKAVGVNFVVGKIQYQGRLNLPDRRAGIFFFKNKKYLVEEGEKIGNIKIVDLKTDYILLLQGKKLYKVSKK